MTTIKYISNYRKHRFELVDEQKKATQKNFYKQRIDNKSNHQL